jgi:hypothetical protein
VRHSIGRESRHGGSVLRSWFSGLDVALFG